MELCSCREREPHGRSREPRGRLVERERERCEEEGDRAAILEANPRGPGRWPGCEMEPTEWSAKFTDMWGVFSVGPVVQ